MKNLKKLNFLIMLVILIMAACENKNIEPTPEDKPLAETDTTRSSVLNTNPSNNATDVAQNMLIKVTFTKEMDASTINASSFTVKQGTENVAGTVSYSSKVATFNPTENLKANLVYKARIGTEVKGINGNNLARATEWTFTIEKEAAEPLAVVDLGAAGNYVILAKTAINNNPTSIITDNMGISPAATSYITGFSLTDATGFATSTQVTGKVFGADMADPTPINLTTAVENMITAYNDAAGRPSPDYTELGTGNIGGQTLAAGLYKWSNTVSIPTDITLSGGSDDVWIFQIAGDLTVSSAIKVTLSGGALPENIFWQVGGETTIGTTAQFKGNVLSMTGITLGTGASHNGRLLAQTAVILDGNALTKP